MGLTALKLEERETEQGQQQQVLEAPKCYGSAYLYAYLLTRSRSVCALLFALRVCYSVCLYAYASLQSLRIQHLFVRSLCCGSVRGTFGKALALTRGYARLHIKGAAALGRQSRQPRTKRLCVYRSADARREELFSSS